MKRLQIEISVVVIFLIIVTSLWVMYKHQREERIRTETNQNALLKDVVRYKTSDSLNVIEVEKLTLTTKEFKKHNADLMETVNKLNLKVRRLQNASSTGTVTTTNISGVVKDSIVYREVWTSLDTVNQDEVSRLVTVKDTLKCIEFSDGWVTAIGCAKNGLFEGQITSRDTLQTFASRIPKFWFIGTKGVKLTIVSSNPHTIIEYHKEIDFKK